MFQFKCINLHELCPGKGKAEKIFKPLATTTKHYNYFMYYFFDKIVTLKS